MQKRHTLWFAIGRMQREKLLRENPNRQLIPQRRKGNGVTSSFCQAIQSVRYTKTGKIIHKKNRKKLKKHCPFGLSGKINGGKDKQDQIHSNDTEYNQ